MSSSVYVVEWEERKKWLRKEESIGPPSYSVAEISMPFPKITIQLLKKADLEQNCYDDARDYCNKTID